MAIFPERLKKLREGKGLSQRELAHLLGFAPSTIAMYETDKRTPDPETLQKLADFFGCSVDYLLGRTDDPSLPVAWTGREDNDPLKDLPEEARRSVLEFIDYVKAKYQKKGG